MGDSALTAEERDLLDLDIVACAVAESFTESYYYTFEKNREDISAFYCPAIASTDNSVPYIAWNGVEYDDGLSFQEYCETLTHTHFEIEGLDADVINPRFLPAAELKGGSGDDTKDRDRRMSIAVVVAGSARLEEPLKGAMREFSETFVLVPNTAKQLSPKPNFEGGWKQEWLIQTQNFRFTEWGASELGGGKEGETKANGGTKNVFRGPNRGIANTFAGAGLMPKGKGKA